MNKSTEVQIAWLEGLIKHSERLNSHKRLLDITDSRQMMLLIELAQLQGYIESAKYLLPEKEEL